MKDRKLAMKIKKNQQLDFQKQEEKIFLPTLASTLITLPQLRACYVCCITAPHIPIKNTDNFCSVSHPSDA